MIDHGPANTVQILENAHAQDAQGAGPTTASMLERHGVTTVIAGRFGPKAENALRAGGILPVAVASGTSARDALARLSGH